jgi:hypothetical protein
VGAKGRGSNYRKYCFTVLSDNSLMMLREKNCCLFCELCGTRKYTAWRNAEFLNIETVGTYRNYYAFKG